MSDILIIDDNYEDIVHLHSILREGGLNVRVCRSAASGIRAAHAIVPDLVLLDVLLPDRDGFETCQQLHASPALADVPVVFVSGFDDAALKAQAFEAGGNDFIAKPYSAKEVIVRVRHQLEHVRLRAKIGEAARLKERQHIARELHDSVSQTLFVLNASVQSVMLDTEGLTAEKQVQLGEIQTLSKGALAEMRTLLYELRPQQIENTSLHRLLSQLVDSYRMRIRAEITVIAEEYDLPADIKLMFYRIAQEALNNLAKHAGARHVVVLYLAQENLHRLVVKDDGGGFDITSQADGFGLQTMRERAEEHHASLKVTSAKGEGTRIAVSWENPNKGG